jgi:hypothetical protein
LRPGVGRERRGVERADIGQKDARERVTIGNANRDERPNAGTTRDFDEEDS